MIKNFENFINDNKPVNESFLDAVFASISDGVNSFKAQRKQDSAIDREAMRISHGTSKVGVDTQLAVAVRELMTTVSLFAEHFVDGKFSADVKDGMQEVKHIELYIEKIKELLPTYCEEQNRYK